MNRRQLIAPVVACLCGLVAGGVGRSLQPRAVEQSGHPVTRTVSALNAGLRGSAIRASMPSQPGERAVSVRGLASADLYREMLSKNPDELIALLDDSLRHASTVRTTTSRTRQLLFRRLMELDFERAIAWFCKDGSDKGINHNSQSDLFSRLIAKDIERAMEAWSDPASPFYKRSSPLPREPGAKNIALPTDAWFERMRKKESSSGIHTLRMLACRVAHQDPTRAAGLRAIFGPHFPQAFNRTPKNVADLPAYLAAAPGKWRDFASRLRNNKQAVDLHTLNAIHKTALKIPEAREAITRAIAETMFRHDRARALRWIEDLPDDLKGDSLSRACYWLALREPEKVFDFIDRYDTTPGFSAQSGLAAVADENGGRDPELAIRALMGIPENHRESLVAEITRDWSRGNLVEAVSLLDDPRFADHHQLIEQQLTGMLSTNRTALLAALRASPLDSDKKEEIQDALGTDGFATHARDLLESLR